MTNSPVRREWFAVGPSIRLWIPGNLEVTVIDNAPCGIIRPIQVASKIAVGIEGMGSISSITETRLEEWADVHESMRYWREQEKARRRDGLLGMCGRMDSRNRTA